MGKIKCTAKKICSVKICDIYIYISLFKLIIIKSLWGKEKKLIFLKYPLQFKILKMFCNVDKAHGNQRITSWMIDSSQPLSKSKCHLKP